MGLVRKSVSFFQTMFCCCCNTTEGATERITEDDSIDIESATATSLDVPKQEAKLCSPNSTRCSLETNSELKEAAFMDQPYTSFTMKFRTLSGEIVDLSCTAQHFPLGVNFTGKSPVHVSVVQLGSSGEELGIKCGWALMGVNNRNVENCKLSEVKIALYEALSRLTDSAFMTDQAWD